MTSCAIPEKNTSHWQNALSKSFTDPLKLLKYLEIPNDNLDIDLNSSFPFRVTHYFAELIEKGNINDPLLKQVLPLAIEHKLVDGFTDDPVGDLASADCSVLKKYHDRSLVITTAACAIHCRYCFRRNFPYDEHQLRDTEIPQIINALKDSSEVILSGGDPLCLSDHRLKLLFNALNKLNNVKRIRIHSRLPIVLPERITSELIATFNSSNKQIIMVVHANHANELTADTKEAILRLKTEAKVTVLNQSVLLSGINDDSKNLIKLSHKLFETGILPYYLHFMDSVNGASHFATSKEKALFLEKEIQQALPGYLVPKLVIEIPGAESKQNLFNLQNENAF